MCVCVCMCLCVCITVYLNKYLYLKIHYAIRINNTNIVIFENNLCITNNFDFDI